MLHLKNIEHSFNNKKKALDIKDLKIEKSCVTCLIGPSGSGKTTLLKVINRLIEPGSGYVEIENARSDRVPPISWRRKIGYVVQDTGLFPHLTVKDNCSLLSRVLKRSPQFIDQRVKELLELVSLPLEYENRWPSELSGGQSQRVGIARALMEDPPLILMDEPFGSLDPITRHALRDEFLNLNKKLKKTILIVTHDLNEAFEMGDKIIFLREGKVKQIGTKRDFKENPSSAFIESFIND